MCACLQQTGAENSAVVVKSEDGGAEMDGASGRTLAEAGVAQDEMRQDGRGETSEQLEKPAETLLGLSAVLRSARPR